MSSANGNNTVKSNVVFSGTRTASDKQPPMSEDKSNQKRFSYSNNGSFTKNVRKRHNQNHQNHCPPHPHGATKQVRSQKTSFL